MTKLVFSAQGMFKAALRLFFILMTPCYILDPQTWYACNWNFIPVLPIPLYPTPSNHYSTLCFSEFDFS